MSIESETLHRPPSRSEPIIKNSPTVYGLGTLGLSAIGHAFSGYYMFYYVDVLGLTVALAAVVNVVYAIWDAVSDPLVGHLSDNTRTRWGHRRITFTHESDGTTVL